MHRQAVLTIIVSAFVSLQASAQKQTVVYPTGSFPLDVQNVQAAVNAGGTVLLKATNTAGLATPFNFGPADSSGRGVDLLRAVTIEGEQAGTARTRISGGNVPVIGFAHAEISVRGIEFHHPLAAAILMLRMDGGEISGNHIDGVVGVPLVFGFTDGDGIDLFGNDDPQHAITGKIRISGNVIENLTADFANGMQFDESSADTEVSGNVVNFPVSSGFVQTVGILAFRSHNRVAITDNFVTMGFGPSYVFPSAIFVGGDSDARYVIARNAIVSNHPNADAIDVAGFSLADPTNGTLIEGNHIAIDSTIPTSGGIALFGAVGNSIVSANRIGGRSGNALQALGLDATLVASSNHFAGNDVRAYAAEVSDVFFGPDSVGNLFTGECRSAIDGGTGNRVLCHPVPPGRVPVPSARDTAMRVLKLGIARAKLDALRNRMPK